MNSGLLQLICVYSSAILQWYGLDVFIGTLRPGRHFVDDKSIILENVFWISIQISLTGNE